MPVIETRELTKHFGGVVAVDHLSFGIEAGTIAGFLGPNGAGKTTTLRLLLGLERPHAGTATISGRAYRDLPDRRHVVGAVLEAAGMHPGRSARNHLWVRAASGGIRADRVDAVLDLVDLTRDADRRIGGFSLGMRQRLALAAALLGDPEILILDEPANGLDPEGVKWLREFLRDLAKHGRTILVSSHILGEVAQTADSVVILDRGRVVTHAPLAELVAGAVETVRVRSPRARDLKRALEADGALAQLVAEDRLEVRGSPTERVGTLAADLSIPVFEITADAPDLEDVFLTLTSAGAREEMAG
jgi:ABC-2 type transport system ATP-binding protein